MTDLAALTKANALRWANVKATRNLSGTAAHLASPAAKERYLAVAAHTGVPWFVIAVIHEREASQNWQTQLGQGDPLNRRSVHVPAGRGPFKTWEDGAVDALVNCAPYAARWRDWSPGGTMTLLERYNGLGYANRGRPSPYVWAGTNQYSSGKYVRDGVYSATTIDTQPGCAGLILAMMAIDHSIQFGAPQAVAPTVHQTGQVIVAPHPTAVPAPPSITHPAAGSIGAWILSFFRKAA